MTPTTSSPRARRRATPLRERLAAATLRFLRSRRSLPERVGAAGVMVLVGGFTMAALTPPPPTTAQLVHEYVSANAQTYAVSARVMPSAEPRDIYDATPGIDTLVEGGTNHDWAKLVLLEGGWPLSDNNVTVLTRWMRQENGPDDWFNRNNPLNNGWGSGGGGGTGTYDSLQDAAINAAEALHENPGYSEIVKALKRSAPTDVTEAAIWASPWATGHYDNGGHWSYVDVPKVTAPEGSWG